MDKRLNYTIKDSIRFVVTSGVSITVMPSGPDLDYGAAKEQSQLLANLKRLPVRLMYHNKPVVQFNPQPQ